MASEEFVHSRKRKAEETENLCRNVRSCASDSATPDVDWQSTKKTVSERTCHMFNNPEMSDISFTCEGSDKTFYAHKYVLATSSVVFHAMFYGDMAEKNSVLHLSDTDEKSLEEFLRFLYTDECNLTVNTVISVLNLSKKYVVPSLYEHLIAHLIRDMEPGNVLNILEQAIQFEEKDLEKKCWQFIEWRASEVIASTETFNNISQKTLASLLKRNNLNVPEVNLFSAVLKWSEFQCSQKDLDLTTKNRRSVIGKAVYDLRFLAMGEARFARCVSKSGLLSTEELVPIYEKFNKLESPSLKWTLPERKRTLNATKEKIRISRFFTFKKDRIWDANDDYRYSKEAQQSERDVLSFSVDQYALFLGVRLFGKSPVNSRNLKSDEKYEVTLKINSQKATLPRWGCTSNRDVGGVDGFDVMLESAILVKKDEVVKMEAIIKGPPSKLGWRGKAKVEVNGITVTFIDSDVNSTCVSQGQFHQIILSV